MSLVHGTEACYTHGGCRCDACREASREARRRRNHSMPIEARREMWREQKRQQRTASA